MKLSFSIASALLVVLSTTTIATEAKKGFKVPIKTVHGPVRAATVSRWVHALRKYNLRPHRHFSGSLKGSKQGNDDSATNLARIPLADYDFDREYYGTVMIGEPPQSFKIDFDTGSSQFIISTKDCTECSGTSHYEPSASKTFRPSGEPWHITYGDMSHAEGRLGHDDVTIDDINVKNQQLAMVYSESAGFDDTIDGIMGLAFGALSSSIASTRTVFENMMDQHLVEKGIFSFYLGKASLQGGGEVIFGDLDMSRVEPGHDITYTPVTKAKYWQIDIRGVYVNDHRVPYHSGLSDPPSLYKRKRKAGHRGSSGDTANSGKKDEESDGEPIPGIMDTGTTLMVVPSKLARGIHHRIKGAQEYSRSWTVPCNLAELEPEGKVEFDIEGKRFKIPYSDIVREEADMTGMCFSGIQMSAASFMIIGDVFIKNNYIVFDMEKQRVGVAPLNLAAGPALPSSAGVAAVSLEEITNDVVEVLSLNADNNNADDIETIEEEGEVDLDEERLQQLFRQRWERLRASSSTPK
ncbi:hypothetical protein BGZ73_001643 [Actinomortierella ambigua]|nr:hypothetical protein BGZ73_001643 [Actinomortierella ambigua]